MTTIRALVPVKPLAQAKTRLASDLSPAERAELARFMVRDVIGVLDAAHSVAGIVLLGDPVKLEPLAREFRCTIHPEDPHKDLCTNLEEAAAALRATTQTMLIIPSDLPALTPPDIEALLAAHAGGATVAVAHDGGTNALVLSPPDALPCLFGPDSARRHLHAAECRGMKATRLDWPAFARDIDTVDDVRWLCAQPAGAAAWDYLRDHGICSRLENS